MYPGTYKKGVNSYANIYNERASVDASPHYLVQLLMEGFLARVNTAKGAMARSDFEQKGLYISQALAVVGGLYNAVNVEKGGEIAINLRQLYSYISNLLLQASFENNVEKLNEAASLMKSIKEGWDAIQN
jgi:flagellar protein FliS